MSGILKFEEPFIEEDGTMKNKDILEPACGVAYDKIYRAGEVQGAK